MIFKCEKDNIEKNYSRYRTFVNKDGTNEYRDSSTGEPIRCEVCKKDLTIVEEDRGVCANFRSRMNVNKRVDLESWDKMNKQDDTDALERLNSM